MRTRQTAERLREALEQQAAVAEVLRVMSRCHSDAQSVFDAIAQRGARLCKANICALTQFDGQLIHLVAFHGTGREAREAMRAVYPTKPGPGTLSARIIRDGVPAEIPDVLADDAFAAKEAARKAGFRSNMGVPMRREGRVVGAIVVARARTGPFPGHQVTLLETFAEQAVIAIENVRLFNETREALERQTATSEILEVIARSPGDVQPVLDAVASSAARLCGARDAIIQLREGQALRFVAHYGEIPNLLVGETRPLSHRTVSGRAVLDARQLHIVDLQAAEEQFPDGSAYARQFGYRTILVTPLLRDGAAIGTIMIRRTEARPFSDTHLALAKTFADQAVIAIDNVRLFNETREALERQTATAEILKVIARSPSEVQPVFQTIVRNAASLCGAMFANVFRYDGQLLHFVASSSPNAEMLELLGRTYPRPADRAQISGRAILARDVVRMEDALADPEYDQRHAIAGRWRRMLGVPMMRDGWPIGSIAVAWADAGPIPAVQEELLKTFADQALIAVENARLFNETREALEQQTATAEILKVIASSPNDVQPVFESIVRNATALCGAMFANVFRYDGELVHFVATSNTNPDANQLVRAIYPCRPSRSLLSGRAILDRAVVRMEDARADPAYDRRFVNAGWRRMLSVPMLRDGRPIGAIIVGWAEPGPIAKAQEDLLRTFADQAVIAVENVRLFTEVQARNRQLTEALEQQTATSDVLKVISRSAFDLQPVLETVVESATRLCGASRGHIFRFDGEALRFAAAHGAWPGFTDYLERHPVRPGRGTVAGRAALERRTVHVTDVRQEPDYEYGELIEQQDFRAVLAVPLLRDGTLLGVIAVLKPTAEAFTDRQIELVTTFADQAVIAIENVRLFNETKEALEQQTATSEVLKAISGSITDTQPVFEVMSRSCLALYRAQQVLLVVRDGERIHRVGYAVADPHVDDSSGEMWPLPLDEQSLSGRAILRGELLHIEDAWTEPGLSESARAISRATRARSALFAPMRSRGITTGALAVVRGEPGRFSDREIELLRIFADQAVIAMENARLFREIQEKSAQLEVANQHKSEFLANMSHELRTPLNAVIGFSEALMEGLFGELNAKQLEYLKDIHESGKHLLSLINDILDLSKIEAGRMELELSRFHLPTALGNAMTLIRERAQRHGIALGLQVDPSLGELEADERKLKQIVLNLLSNAVKFTRDGGRVDLSARLEDARVEIAVKDTGIGIAPEDHAAVFEAFRQVGSDYTRKAEGTGLGLALTRRFVELHGGEIRLESAPGKGSRFAVTLPVRP